MNTNTSKYLGIFYQFLSFQIYSKIYSVLLLLNPSKQSNLISAVNLILSWQHPPSPGWMAAVQDL